MKLLKSLPLLDIAAFVALLVIWFLLLCATNEANSGERDIVVYLDGCSAFVVDDNLLVSAKHCEQPETLAVSIQGRTVNARKVASAAGEDGPVVYLLPGGPYECFPVADSPPQVGELVTALGYPGGHWASIEGEVVGGNSVDLNYVAMRLNPGNSGGPLLNSAGEVVGVGLHVAHELGVNQSGFAGLRVLKTALEQARQTGAQPYQRSVQRTRVVVFSLVGCGPCERLKSDVQAGKFSNFDFEFCTFDYRIQQWDKPELHAEFVAECNPGESLGAPTIWIPGTGKFRQGYNEPVGIIGWIDGIVRSLLMIPKPTIPNGTPEPIPEPPQAALLDRIGTVQSDLEAVREELKSIKSDTTIQDTLDQVAEIKSSIANMRHDFETIKTGTIAEKLQAVTDFRAEVSDVKNSVDNLRKTARDARDDPLGFVLSIVGGIASCAAQTFLERKGAT